MIGIAARYVEDTLLLLSRLIFAACQYRRRKRAAGCYSLEEGYMTCTGLAQEASDGIPLMNHSSPDENPEVNTGHFIGGNIDPIAMSSTSFACSGLTKEAARIRETTGNAPYIDSVTTPGHNSISGVVRDEPYQATNEPLPIYLPDKLSMHGQNTSYTSTAARSQDKVECHQREFLTSHAGCDDIEFAIICALPVEAGAVQSLLERRDGMPKLKKQKGDPIMYTAGYFGQHRVVLAHMGTKGNINACRVAQYCKGSFPSVKFMMVVGICGAVPTNDPDNDPILGDAIIGTAVAQTDFGTYYEDGFTTTSRIVDMLGRSSIGVSSKISWLQTDENCESIRRRAASLVKELQRRGHPSAVYPGTQHDKLYVPTYTHADDGKKCSEICNGTTIERSRLVHGEPEHAIHFGLFGSGNQVIRSAKARDQLLQRLNIKAVEMESAGVWDVCPCIVVKSACDYADSHKMKDFQRYAATTAAATVRAILEFWDE